MGEKYNQNNMNYYQHFVNYVSQMDPGKCKYFDESGFKLTTAHRNYGHDLVGEKCVEVGRLVDNPNTTLNLLVFINGINHFNFVYGASNTDTFVNFFFEAANSVSENGFPALEPGDLVIVDNCSIHRFNGEVRVSNFLQQMGIGYICLTRYSTELNIAENCFLKVKTVLKQEQFLNIVRSNLNVAIGQALQEITINDLKEFCVATGCLNVQ
jgi:transposase